MATKQTQGVPPTAEGDVPVSSRARKTALWPSIGWAPPVVVILALGAVVLFTFCNTLQPTPTTSPPTGFALDNKFIILEDPRLHEATRDNLMLIFTQDYWWPKAVSGLYRPLTTLSYMFNYS